ncbi:MAG: hypothetical protein R2788_21460 [Saprospiraceae bacterium]
MNWVQGSLLKLLKSLHKSPVNVPLTLAYLCKNLFYNVPARRNFLKSNAVEMRHILDEFQRVALANTDIFSLCTTMGLKYFHLTPDNLRQRIVWVFSGMPATIN